MRSYVDFLDVTNANGVYHRFLRLVREQSVSMRDVYFIVKNNFGSSIMRGYQVAEELSKRNVLTKVINVGVRYPLRFIGERLIKSLRNSIVVFVKYVDQNLLKIVKTNQNLVSWMWSTLFPSYTSTIRMTLVHVLKC